MRRIFSGLASQHELETEGRKLSHCVASYGIKCLVSGSFIFSIRDCHGNHFSTFEIQFEHDLPILQQHKALNNEEPEPAEIVTEDEGAGEETGEVEEESEVPADEGDKADDVEKAEEETS